MASKKDVVNSLKDGDVGRRISETVYLSLCAVAKYACESTSLFLLDDLESGVDKILSNPKIDREQFKKQIKKLLEELKKNYGEDYADGA